MGENESPKGAIGETVDAVSKVIDKIPIYQDAVQPAAQEVGKGLLIVARAVTTALAPVEGLIWGVEKIREFVREKVSEKLENVPPEDIQPPKPHVGVPVIEALRYTGDEESLSELYANLLANSMDKKTAYEAHPAFVDIIKSMSPDEAKIMQYLAQRPSQPLIEIRLAKNDYSFAVVHRQVSLLGFYSGCDYPELVATYIDNLKRLGLLDVPDGRYMKNNEAYKAIEEHPYVVGLIDPLKSSPDAKVKIERQKVEVTSLGRQFVNACVIDKRTRTRG